MIDYNYYLVKFGGKIFDSESEFNKYRDKSVRYINSVTARQGRDSEIGEAVCVLSEFYFKNGESCGIKSESIDGVSVTYDNEKTQRNAYSILKLYLPSNLLYRGLWVLYEDFCSCFSNCRIFCVNKRED